MEEDVSNHISDKELIFKIYLELATQQQKINSPI